MDNTLLKRVYLLAEEPPSERKRSLGSVARALSRSDLSAAEKAHFVVGVLKKLAPGDQELLVAACEAVR